MPPYNISMNMTRRIPQSVILRHQFLWHEGHIMQKENNFYNNMERATLHPYHYNYAHVTAIMRKGSQVN